MLNLGLESVLTLLAVAVAVSFIWYYLFKIKLPGGYFATLIVAWLGAWVGTPIMGTLVERLVYANIGIVPAVLTSLAAILLANNCAKCKS